MKRLIHRAWRRVHEPRTVAIAQTLIYVAFAYGAFTALVDPPRTVEGAIGESSMMTLAIMLLFGGLLGAPSALLGAWRWERVAMLPTGLATVLYGLIIFSLNITQSGNRQLQLMMVVTVFLQHIIRWRRIRQRPFDPGRPPRRTA